MTNPQEQFFDFYRAGLAATADMIRMSLEGAQRLLKQQLAAIDAALAAHAGAVAEIDGAKGFEALVAVQGKLASVQYQMVIDCWNGLYEAAGESQTEVTKRVQAQAEQIRENFQNTLGSPPDATVPMLVALQPLMDVASSAYALTARAAEEATKLAAAQLAATKAGILQAAESVRRQSG